MEDNKIALIGTRDLDPLEQQLLMASDISLFSPQVLRKDPTLLLSHFPPSVQAVYIHLNLDVIDPSVGRANTFATPGGLTIEEIVEMLQLIKQRYTIAAIAFTAYDPSLDQEGKASLAVHRFMDSILQD